MTDPVLAAADRHVPAWRLAFYEALAVFVRAVDWKYVRRRVEMGAAETAIEELPWPTLQTELEARYLSLLQETMLAGAGAAVLTMAKVKKVAAFASPELSAFFNTKKSADWSKINPGVYETTVDGVTFRAVRVGTKWQLQGGPGGISMGEFPSLTSAQASLPRTPPVAQLVGRFDMVNPEAVRFANLHTARLVRDVTNETRAGLRAIVAQGQEEGLDVRAQAGRIVRNMRDSVGLTRQQAASLARFSTQLEASGKLEPAVIRERSAEFAERLRNQRAETIARHETVLAANAGQERIWQDATQEGFLPPDQEFRWLTAKDQRTCPICKPMDGQRRRLGEEFESPYNGARALHPPIHVQCRCSRVIAT